MLLCQRINGAQKIAFYLGFVLTQTVTLPWSCDFGDPATGFDTCNFQQDTADDFDWIVNYGGTNSSDTGPPEDTATVQQHGKD